MLDYAFEREVANSLLCLIELDGVQFGRGRQQS